MSKLLLFLIIFVNINNYSFVYGQDFISKNPKVVAGSRAVQSQYPFVVSVIPVLKSGRGVSCTGAIITDKWVITPAHCLNKTGDVDGAIVLAAVMDSLSEQGSPNTQERKSIHIVKHEGNTQGGKNSWDVALLEVSEPFVFDEYVRSIALAKKPLPTTTMTCVAIGYGFTTQAGANSNSYLYSLPTSAGDYQYCNKKNPNRVVGEEYVCLVPDSDNQAMSSTVTGGPLVCGGLLVGVLNGTENNEGEVGDNCVGENCTQVYMFAGYYESWIREHVANIPDFLPLPEGKLRNAVSEYQTEPTKICIPCANTVIEELTASLRAAHQAYSDCQSDNGCIIKYKDENYIFYASGKGPCKTCDVDSDKDNTPLKMCIPCDSKEKFKQKLEKDGIQFSECQTKEGCNKKQIKAIGMFTTAVAPGYGICKSCGESGTSGTNNENTPKNAGTIKTTFSCFTIGMLMMNALMFN